MTNCDIKKIIISLIMMSFIVTGGMTFSDKDLIKKIESGDYSDLNSLLSSANLNKIYENDLWNEKGFSEPIKRTLLAHAIASDNQELGLKMLQLSADPFITNVIWDSYSSHSTALQFAAGGHLLSNTRKETAETIAILTEILAHKNLTDHIDDQDDFEGQTALHLAAWFGNRQSLKLLLDKGASINKQTTKYGDTALHLAAEKGHAEVVKMLLAKNDIDKTIKNKTGKTALEVAKENNHEEIIALLEVVNPFIVLNNLLQTLKKRSLELLKATMKLTH